LAGPGPEAAKNAQNRAPQIAAHKLMEAARMSTRHRHHLGDKGLKGAIRPTGRGFGS